MRFKAIFLDIDGTLVSFQTHQIPTSTIEALKIAKHNGAKLFISTGRPTQIINNIDPIKDLIDGYISFNGACCNVGESILDLKPISTESVKCLLDDASKREYPVVVCGKTKIAVHNYKPIFSEIFIKQLGVTNIDLDLCVEGVLSEPILQLTPFFTREEETTIMPLLKDCVSARWHDGFADITVNGADKGSAIKVLASYLSIDLKACMAFGDGGNDLAILQTAGVGVAMGNAADEVKAVADYVTSSVDDDGIKNALLHFDVVRAEQFV